MKARDINRKIEKAGGSRMRQRGSHRFYQITANGKTYYTTVPQHAGDIPTGTLAAIDRDLAEALGKGWTKK